MIDRFTIFTTGGIVLWESVTDSASAATVNSFISQILIGQTSGVVDSFRKDNQTVRWATSNDLGIVFVAVYQSILQLSYMEDFLSSIVKLFISLYKQDLVNLNSTDTLPDFNDFTKYYSLRLSQVEKKTPPQPVVVTNSPKKSSKRAGKRANKHLSSHNDAAIGSGTDDSITSTKSAKSTRARRKWGVDGMPDEELASGVVLDYSQQHDQQQPSESKAATIQGDADWDSTIKDGDDVLVKDLSTKMNEILSKDDDDKKPTASKSALSFFKGITGGNTITNENLQPALIKMKEHLMKKNIAPQVAEYLCESVLKKNLIGTKTGNWTSIEKTVKESMQAALRKILTPKASIDLLHEIKQRKLKNEPYVISVVGVNGVGKSTNLSKIAYWLIQNNLSILIAACDTFRSGAIEQLRVHAKNLSELTSRNNGGSIELYERGYGKDAANIAKDAIDYAREKKINVVLIDTAGRRHNDLRLMSSLEKFAKYAKPDKIIMVGEALVGTDSVEQANNFNKSFGNKRNLDFFLISKCDTVGDMIGTIINMTYSTSIPVLFIGVGQMYTDLRTLNIEWAVNVLMS